MRPGLTKKVAALAIKIGTATERYNSDELTRGTHQRNKSLGKGIRQLAGRCNNTASQECYSPRRVTY